MNKNNGEKNAKQNNSDTNQPQSKEAWLNRNIPLFIGFGAFALILLMSLMMRYLG